MWDLQGEHATKFQMRILPEDRHFLRPLTKGNANKHHCHTRRFLLYWGMQKDGREMADMRPVYDMLTAASARRSGHMPGHKGRPPFGTADLYALDTTELPNTDDLYAAEGGLREAMRLYAQAAGAAKTIFLHNGSTAGNHVMLQLYARDGETVLLPRNAHLSAVNACVLGGMRVKWMPVRCTPDG